MYAFKEMMYVFNKLNSDKFRRETLCMILISPHS